MQGFNEKARTTNAFKSVGMGVANQLVNIITGFVFRTVFLMVLSKEYLGINGLFTNILNVLSLAELGIGSAIVFRMYEPISINDVHKVSCIMEYYKKVYRIIALIVGVIGFSMLPLIKFMIKDLSEVPSDVNIYVVYGLFVFQSLASYFFIYKTSIFSADQKGYIISLGSIITVITSISLRIAVLLITKDFVATLVTGIVVTLLANITLSVIATKKYAFVFKSKDRLDKETKALIKKDTLAMSCHKIGGCIVGSTDNILLSAFVGIGVLGIYSNYSLILVAVGGLLGQIFGSFISSIGNVKIKNGGEHYFETYNNLLYVNLVVVSCVCVALFTLFNPFITVWLGADMLLSEGVVAVMTVSYFFSNLRHINITFTMASGLFKRDKARPIVEAVVNLVASLLLVKFLGVVGIFFGTIISNVSVVFWREPYLLFKKEFKKPKLLLKYFAEVFVFLAYAVAMSALMYYVIGLMPNNVGYLILKFLIVGVVPVAGLVALTFWTDEFKFTLGKVKSSIFKILHRGKRAQAIIEQDECGVKQDESDNEESDVEKLDDK